MPLRKDGHPRIPSLSQQCKREKRAGAPLSEALFILGVLPAIRSRLTNAHDLIIDSAPILAWRRANLDAAFGHAPAQHPRPLLLGYRVHTLICRSSSLPLFFLLSPANVHDAPPRATSVGMGCASLADPPTLYPFRCSLLGIASYRLNSCDLERSCDHPLEPQATKEPLLFALHLDFGAELVRRCTRCQLAPDRYPRVKCSVCSNVNLTGWQVENIGERVVSQQLQGNCVWPHVCFFWLLTLVSTITLHNHSCGDIVVRSAMLDS